VICDDGILVRERGNANYEDDFMMLRTGVGIVVIIDERLAME